MSKSITFGEHQIKYYSNINMIGKNIAVIIKMFALEPECWFHNTPAQVNFNNH
jgi:hypothetical protein